MTKPTNTNPPQSSSKLSSDMANTVVKYGKKRVLRSGIVGSFDPILNIASKNQILLTHSDLSLGICLGQGSFSRVYEVTSVKSKKAKKKGLDASKIVVKVLRKEKMMDNPKMFAACAGDLFKEALMLAKLQHPHVVGAQAFAAGGIDAYKSGHHDAFFIVLDKLEETLSDRIKYWQSQHSKSSKNKLTLAAFTSQATKSKNSLKKIELLQSQTQCILQLADAIQYIHSQGMIHRDIKPDNIGFDYDGNVKVFDFDVARVLPPPYYEKHHQQDSSSEGEIINPNDTLLFKLTKRVGSPRYMAGEVALGESYNSKVDVYAFGLLIHEILTLKKPYSEIPSECHDDAVFVLGERPYIPKRKWTTGLSNLVERCWSINVMERPTSLEAYELALIEIPKYVEFKMCKFNKRSSSKKNTAGGKGSSSQQQQQGNNGGGGGFGNKLSTTWKNITNKTMKLNLSLKEES